ncbi:MAG TPA: AIM24 family protein, partial [Mycobacteriales bacterium]|nr:AIM24 family protein [Mycobacteriales bacterium]
MRSELFDAQNMAQASTGVGISLQHSRCVKAVVNGEMLARQGAMVAYRGNLGMQVKSQGVGNFLKRAVTGEGLSLMSVRGQGEIWFASLGHKCFLVDIEPGDGLSINGRNVLCFEAALQYEIRMVQGAGMFGGGLFNSLFTGSGRLALTCDGDPIVLPVTPDVPVFVDTDALV